MYGLSGDDLDGAVSSIVICGGVVEVCRTITDKNMDRPIPSRGKISYLSAKSRTRMLAVMKKTRIEFGSMMTLTYPKLYPRDGTIVKYHLRRFLDAYKRMYATSYFWFLEFQQRGAPHFHLLSAHKPVSDDDRVWLGDTWSRIVVAEADGAESTQERVRRVHAHTKQWQDIRDRDGAVKYLAKYALKTYQKDVPLAYQNVGRFWGCSSDVRLNTQAEHTIPIEGDVLRWILENDGHKASKFDVLPRYLFDVPSLTLDNLGFVR